MNSSVGDAQTLLRFLLEGRRVTVRERRQQADVLSKTLRRAPAATVFRCKRRVGCKEFVASPPWKLMRSRVFLRGAAAAVFAEQLELLRLEAAARSGRTIKRRESDAGAFAIGPPALLRQANPGLAHLLQPPRYFFCAPRAPPQPQQTQRCRGVP